MAIVGFLAVTPRELGQWAEEGWHPAWMACHFSPYGRGLSNLPQTLPQGSLLLVDDQNPIQDHDRLLVSRQIQECTGAFSCAGVLLDFQRPGNSEAEAMVSFLERNLTCPLGVSALYGKGGKCAVCLPPPPCHVPLKEHLAPWQGREIWLELAGEGETIFLTKTGAKITPSCTPPEKPPFREPVLHCRYTISTEESQARFTLWRTREDLEDLTREAETLGVTRTLGLWQELMGRVDN